MSRDFRALGPRKMDSSSNFDLENISPKILNLIFLSWNKFRQNKQFPFAKTLKKSYALKSIIRTLLTFSLNLSQSFRFHDPLSPKLKTNLGSYSSIHLNGSWNRKDWDKLSENVRNVRVNDLHL